MNGELISCHDNEEDGGRQFQKKKVFNRSMSDSITIFLANFFQIVSI